LFENKQLSPHNLPLFWMAVFWLQSFSSFPSTILDELFRPISIKIYTSVALSLDWKRTEVGERIFHQKSFPMIVRNFHPSVQITTRCCHYNYLSINFFRNVNYLRTDKLRIRVIEANFRILTSKLNSNPARLH